MLDCIELKFGFRLKSDFRERKNSLFLNRENLDQVSNSKAPFVFVLDFLMADQQPENKSTVEETEVLAPEAEAEALIKLLVDQLTILRRQSLLS